jgi:hypothetical protein
MQSYKTEAFIDVGGGLVIKISIRIPYQYQSLVDFNALNIISN